MSLDWSEVEGSSLVVQAAFDDAAQRIHIRLSNGDVRVFTGGADRWAEFWRAMSKGQYLTRVLARYEVEPDEGGRRAAPGELAAVLNAFKPAQEIEDPKLFAGRREQIKELARGLQVEGSCLLIYGDRGLGKSSLAVQGQLIAMGDTELLAARHLDGYGIDPAGTFIVVYVSCSDGVRDLATLVGATRNAINRLLATREGSAGPDTLSTRTTTKKAGLKNLGWEESKTYVSQAVGEQQGLTAADQLRIAVARLTEGQGSSAVLLIYDEFDTVPDKSGVAGLIKSLSSDSLKFMLVGIAQNWSELLLDHLSLERQIHPIRVPLMEPFELADIVDRAEKALTASGIRLRFSPDARKRLVEISGGFPWFVHVLGQAAFLGCWESGEEEVSRDLLTLSARDLVHNRYAERYADLYQQAVQGSVKREQVLRFLAAAKGSTIRSGDVYPPLQAAGVTNPPVYVKHLISAKYGSVLFRPGFQNRGLIGFRDPMFKQYVRIAPALMTDD